MTLEGDVFGKIYEYFLGKFAMAEGQRGGEFFTPTSLVKLIVEVIEPYHGRIHDPACGSGGMFVQSAKFVDFNEKLHELNEELERLNAEAHELEGNIAENVVKILEERPNE